MAKTSKVTVRANVLDKIIQPFAPGWARQRLTERVAFANLERAYEGATKGRGTDGWKTATKTADGEIVSSAALLRNRMRDLVRNNPDAAKAVSVLVNHMVGSGIKPRANTGNKATDARINKLFNEWSKKCDADGHTDFHGLTALATRGMIEGGDMFGLRRYRRASDGLKVPLQIQLMEADHLDSAKNEDRNGTRIRHGIQYNAIGRRTHYWMFPDHPGDSNPTLNFRSESDPIPADRVVHLFERQRLQSRGVPWGTPVLRALRDMDDWTAAELVRKKTEACMVGIVFGDDEAEQNIAPSVEDADGNIIEQFEPGLIAYARGSKNIEFNQPKSTAGVYEWSSMMRHVVAAGFRVPYELMTGDLKQVSFASGRIGLNDFKRLVASVQQHIIIPMFCQPLWDWFVDAAYTAGHLPMADVPVEWSPPKFESVNPLQDVTADILETRAGFASPQDQIGKRGRDPETVIQEWVTFLGMTDPDGLVFDIDASKVTKGGQMQADDFMGGVGDDDDDDSQTDDDDDDAVTQTDDGDDE